MGIILKKKNIIIFSVSAALVVIGFFLLTLPFYEKLKRAYDERASAAWRDRNGAVIRILPNASGNYAFRETVWPENLTSLAIKKEDRFFYWHLGLNPVSTARAIFAYARGEKRPSSSTITQQTVKLLLKQERERSLRNKLEEAFYSLALEMHAGKNDILSMYLNTVFFGNQTEGAAAAASYYFGDNLSALNTARTIQLLAAISNPTSGNPCFADNVEAAKRLARRLKKPVKDEEWTIVDKRKAAAAFEVFIKSDNTFEFENLGSKPGQNLNLAIDNDLATKIRAIIKRETEALYAARAYNAAAVVIATGRLQDKNELIAMIGSPDPLIDALGYRINMALKPRAIGSTIKPFIYTQGFSRGLRPYTTVDDREYKYTIGTGFAFYPKNYDYEYRGPVNLHFALANSLNVPAVKVLEYIGLENFYSFLEHELNFTPVQNLSNYQLGIALGELEMDLLSLVHYFTVFPNEGMLKPLAAVNGQPAEFQTGADLTTAKEIFSPDFVALVNKIISDRQTGVEEFGMKSSLNLPQGDYAVKTGTSREFHDSWTVGYTPDFTVGVWVGNAADTPMDRVSGQAGAGRIWQAIMNLLLNSPYNKNSRFDFSALKEFPAGTGIEYGLAGDNYNQAKNLLDEDRLILSPHPSDDFLMKENLEIPLTASQAAEWFSGAERIGAGQEMLFQPNGPGTYTIKAVGGDKEEEVTIYINRE